MHLLFLFVFGLIIGSFIGAYTYRWPMGISVKEGRSFCPKCKAKISWYDNIPLLSYILLSGKCRNCKKKISLRYPLIELSTAAIFVLVYTLQGASFKGIALPFFLLITAALIIIFVIDLEHNLIPDEAVFFIFTLAFLNLLFSSNKAFYTIFFSAFLASTFFLLLHLITKGRGMGLGDVKLVMALGLMFAYWKLLLVWIFLSFIIGSVVGVFLIATGKAKWGKKIPFGPFLVVSFFATIFWGDTLAGLLLPYL